MSKLPLHIQRAIGRYEPVKTDGLTLYPILVDEYDLFLAARPALEVLHQSLPVALLKVPLLAALYRMDYKAVQDGEQQTGLFSSALLGLALALRVGKGLDPNERLARLHLVVDKTDHGKLKKIVFLDENQEEKEITPVQYKKIREIIAAQNGVKLESDNADPELVQAEKDIAAQNNAKLDINIYDLISGVATLSGTDEADIYQWPILKLTNRERSYQRILDYIICGVGQANGTTWKGGNPVPHPFYEKEKSGFGAHIALSGWAGGAGERAVANAGSKTL